MDKRKLEQFKKQTIDSADELNILKIVNSSKMNEALIDNVERMNDLEFVVKQKSQLKYLQDKQ